MPEIYTKREFSDTELFNELQRIVGDTNQYIEVARRGCVVDGTVFEGGNGFNVREVLAHFVNQYKSEEAYIADDAAHGVRWSMQFPFSTR